MISREMAQKVQYGYYLLSSAERPIFRKVGFYLAFSKLFVKFSMVQAILFRIFWAFVGFFTDKNDFLNFFSLNFIAIHICITSSAKLSFASVV